MAWPLFIPGKVMTEIFQKEFYRLEIQVAQSLATLPEENHRSVIAVLVFSGCHNKINNINCQLQRGAYL
jgi:hypothetical protein